MDIRTISGSRLRFLYNETERWAKEGLIPSETRNAILARYESPGASDWLRRAFFAALTALGALLLGLAALLLVCYNWKGLVAYEKFAIIGGAMGLSYFAAWGLSLNGKRVLSEIACLLGALLYGAGIWQIAQVYHVAAYYPHGVLMWAVGVLALAMCLRTPILHCLAAVLLVIWMGWEIEDYSQMHYVLFGLDGFEIPNCAWGLPILAGAGWMSARWRGKSEAAAETIRVLYTLVFWGWMLWCPLAMEPGGLEICFYYLLLGCVMFLVPQFTERVCVAGILTMVAGMFVMGIALIPPSFDIWDEAVGFESPTLFGFTTLLAVGALGYLLVRCARRRLWDTWRNQSFFTALFVYAYTLFIVVQMMDVMNLQDDAGLFVQNIAMFLFGIAFMRRGVHLRQGAYFVFGVLYFLLWVLLRYIDLFGGFGGMLGAAGMFAFCAVVLFGLSYFWFHQKKRLPADHGGEKS